MRPEPWCSYPYSLITIIALLLPMQAYPAGLGEIAQRMAGSEFVFNRARSDIPFVPIAWLDVTVYDESRFMLPSGGPSDISFGQKTLSEATLVPFLLGSRDAFVVGQWMSWTRFDFPRRENMDVFSAALPIGWARQASADWQLAAFVAPLAHTSDNDGVYWEYMGGVFARWLHGDRLAWLFGFYGDVAPREEYWRYMDDQRALDRERGYALARRPLLADSRLVAAARRCSIRRILVRAARAR